MKNFILFVFLLLCIGKSYAQDVEDYIEEHLSVAQNLMHEKKLPASIILGVAIHESAAGKSKVARYLNNHFGIKGKNNNKEIKSAYRDYDQVEDSYEHFTEYLISKPSYNKLFTTLSTYNFKAWAKGIHRGGYAASRTWAQQVIAIINKYKLYEYDVYPEGYVEEEIVEPEVYIPAKKIVSAKIYTVKKNDNLSSIAKKLGTTAVKLKQKNKLQSIVLQPGQKLKY